MARSLRILVIGLNYAPEPIGIAKYTTEMCEDLVRRGHSVNVVTTPPYYPGWRVADAYRQGRLRRETRNGVVLRRVPIYVPANPRGIRRIVHLFSFAVSAAPAALVEARKFRPDIVLAIAPALTAAPVALVAARASGARSWLHIQDFEIDAAFELGILSGGFLRRIALRMERAVLRAFDRVSSISPRMVDNLRAKGVETARTMEFRNWVDTGALRPLDRMTGLRRSLGLGADEIVALYSGNMSAKQGLETIVDAAKRTAQTHPRLHYVICGDGPARAALEASASGLANVHFLSLQPAELLPELLSSADIHLLPQRAEAADLVLPSKLGGILASGRPVVVIAGPGTGLAAETADCGIAVPPGDDKAFADAILHLADTPDERARLGAAARRRAEAGWEKRAILDRFEDRLLALAGGAGKETD